MRLSGVNYNLRGCIRETHFSSADTALHNVGGGKYQPLVTTGN